MTLEYKELNKLLHFFPVQNYSNHIISLALTANESIDVGLKQQSASFEHPFWDLLNAENSSFLNQYIDNSSLLIPYVANATFSNHTRSNARPRISTEIPIWLIPCYSIILIFAIVGNLLVASTLFQNRRMRTITNVFLANLAISDMLLGVLCMPITLVGTYLRHFIFGELVCKFIQFAQAASVAVSSWTLVAISCERYYAICHPLRSRTWQTINHAYKIIGCIWCSSIICMAPIAIFSQLIPTSRQGLRKCREQWPEEAVGYERSYNIFLDLVLLVLPLAILCVAYILITRTLYMGIKDEKALIYGSKNNNMTNSGSGGGGDGKIYTKLKAEMKSPSIFHLNMSLRFHKRKGAANALGGSNIFAGPVNNDETLQIAEEATTNKSREIKYFSSTGIDNKYSAMGGTGYGRKGLCYSLAENTAAETELSARATQEHTNNRQTLRQQCDDAASLAGACDSNGTEPAAVNAVVATTKTRALASKSMDTHRPQLYYMRSASFKSLNHNKNCIESSQNEEEPASLSCFSLNAMPTTYFSKIQQRQQGFNQTKSNQQNIQLMEFREQQRTAEYVEKRKLIPVASLRSTESALRRSNLEKNLESKRRVVKMLFVLVLEFFICWTPLYVINTVAMFIGPAIYEYVDYTTISFFQLLAYSSSCCNPITYCFMNASFRRAFVDTFKGMHLNGGRFWHKNSKSATNLSAVGNSIALANSCTVVTANTLLDSPRL